MNFVLYHFILSFLWSDNLGKSIKLWHWPRSMYEFDRTDLQQGMMLKSCLSHLFLGRPMSLLLHGRKRSIVSIYIFTESYFLLVSWQQSYLLTVSFYSMTYKPYNTLYRSQFHFVKLSLFVGVYAWQPCYRTRATALYKTPYYTLSVIKYLLSGQHLTSLSHAQTKK